MELAFQRRHNAAEYAFLGATLALLTIGIDMVFSASFVVAHNSPQYGSATYFLTRQALWAGLGLAAMIAMARIDYRRWHGLSILLMSWAVFMLMAVLWTPLGQSEYGAQRWLRLGPISLQPSEFAKLAVIIYFADWLSGKGAQVRNLTYGSVPFALLLSLVAGLVLLQPDLGTALVIVATAVGLFFIAGANLVHFGSGLVLGGAALVLLVAGAGYRAQRLAAFLNPEKDPLGIGWHTIQSQIALGSGGLWGVGLGASRQKFYYLPSAHTDAIFAVIGEELGLVGALGVLALVGLFAYGGFRIALAAADPFGGLLAAGVTWWIVLQALLNIAVVLALVPFTGVPLPFVSAGGSALVVSLAGVGLLLSVSRHRGSRLSSPQEHGRERSRRKP